MTPDQLTRYRAALEQGKQPVENVMHTFPRAWNEALEFATRKLNEILSEQEILNGAQDN